MIRSHRRSPARRVATALATATTAAIAIVGITDAAQAATSNSWVVTPGTTRVGSTFYAKPGANITLRVTADAGTRCIKASYNSDVKKAPDQTSADFTWTSVAGVTSAKFIATTDARVCNNNGIGGLGDSESLVFDSAAPQVVAALTPSPNAAGWNKSDVTIDWSATDTGSGVATGPTPANDSVTAETTSATKTSNAVDRVGNPGSGSVTVRLDKTPPTVTTSQSPGANGAGWNNSDVTVSFSCADGMSGIKTCPSPQTLTSSGAANAVAVDTADNTTGASRSVQIDKVKPTLTGTPTTPSNAAGWYKSSVAIGWSADDDNSGVVETPADSTISGEGANQVATATVFDKAGNSTTASSASVNIDKTAPVTTATAPPGWTNSGVTVQLVPTDGLSGVAETHYRIGAGPDQDGTEVTLENEGKFDITFWSVDKAGNVEDPSQITVQIDKTDPTITHIQEPEANGNGWNNSPVTVTFTCEDAGGSGVASCTEPQDVSTEGAGQSVPGTAIDNAGNSATDPATVSVDLTKPTITAAASPPPNVNDWNNSDVTVTFTCQDALSGIDTCSDAATLSTESAGQTVEGAAVDNAGNSESVTSSTINIDKTSPTISGHVVEAMPPSGWYPGDVHVHWTCGDALSGIDGACPADSLVDGEGGDLSASVSVSDLAGNQASATVDGIKIDRTAPTTTIDVSGNQKDSWYRGSAHVELAGLDPLSGVMATSYQIDDGDFVDYPEGGFDISDTGIHLIRFFSTDKAGNVEAALPGTEVKVDGLAPTIAFAATPEANAFGWNNTPVTVSVSCTDADSGIDTCEPPFGFFDNEAEGQTFDATATDLAGNSATVESSPAVNIDLTKPTLSGAATTAPNGNGWYNGDVTIAWTGVDALSGIDTSTQPANSLIIDEGADLGAGPVTIKDKAGNESDAASVSGIKIDRTRPTVVSTSLDGGPFALGAVPAPSCTGADVLSGPDTCSVTVTGPGGVGSYSYSAVATDKAGNQSLAKTGTFKVVFRFDGFLQPINDTGHSGGSASIFKAGSTIPVKLQLKKADGTVVQGSAPVLVAPEKGAAMTSPVNESVFSDTPSSGGEFKWDPVAQQWIYTLGTKGLAAGFYYRIGAKLPDGSTQYVVIGLK